VTDTESPVTMLVDVEALHDPRVVELARRLGWSRRETVGALLDVWTLCYQSQETSLRDADIDIAAARDGFAVALREASLARADGDLTYVRGAQRALENVESSNARAGARRARTPRARRARTRGVRTRAYGSPSEYGGEVLQGGEDLHSGQGDTEDTDTDLQEGGAIANARGARVPREQIRRVTDAFQSRWEATYRTKPRWAGREFRNIKALIRSHGANEVVRRVHVMFDDPPPWMTPPLTLNTFVAQFDAFVMRGDDARRAHDASRPPAKHGRHDPDPARPRDTRTPQEVHRDSLRARGLGEDGEPLPPWELP
jgi:hypothetical protein